MKNDKIASDNQHELNATTSRDEPVAGEPDAPESIPNHALLERVMERSNLQRALKQVRQNKGAPGIDGMTVDVLPAYLKEHWLELRERLRAGTCKPQPVRRVQIPKPDGRVRLLGIPTVLDRFIQQAIAHGVSVRDAWHIAKSAHGPWRLSKTPTRARGVAGAVLRGNGTSRIGGEVGTFHRTAVYVIRTHGGVGGEAP